MDSSTKFLSNKYENTNLSLKQQVMLNQLISIAGCTYDEAYELLTSSNWQYQTALSAFFGDIPSIVPTPNNPCCNSNLCLCAPSNTPCTPPNLDYLENAFSKLSSNNSQQQLPQTQSSSLSRTNNNNNSTSSMDVNYSNTNLISSNSSSSENMFYLQTGNGNGNNTHNNYSHSTTSSINIQNNNNNPTSCQKKHNSMFY